MNSPEKKKMFISTYIKKKKTKLHLISWNPWNPKNLCMNAWEILRLLVMKHRSKWSLPSAFQRALLFKVWFRVAVAVVAE